MSTKKHRKNQATATTLRHIAIDSGLANHVSKKNKKASKTSQPAYDITLDSLNDAASRICNPQRSNNCSRSGRIVDMCNHIHREDGILGGDVRRSTAYDKCLNEINGQLDQRIPDARIDQLLISRKCSSKGVNLEPNQFSEALEILKLKRNVCHQRSQFAPKDSERVELFLRRNYSQESEYSARSNKQIEDDISYRKVKNQHGCSSNKSFSPRPSNKIVVLRPTPTVVETPEHVKCSCSSHQCFKSKGRNVKPRFFSFKEIKRRWRRAIGANQEKRRWISSIVSLHKIPTRKGINAVACDTESDKSQEKRDPRSRIGPETSTTDELALRTPDIFHEAKKHLSERLRRVNRSEVLENKQTRRTLGRILCSPEHDLYNPASPIWNVRHGFVSTERKFSHIFSANDGKVTPLIALSLEDESNIFETIDVGEKEDLSTFEVPVEPMDTDSGGGRHSPDMDCNGDHFNRSFLASPSHDRVIKSSSDVSPSNPISPQEVVENIKDRGDEHQSPVSVLEPLFTEDSSSPTSIIVRTSKGKLQPRRLDFEEYAPVSLRDPEIKRVDSMSEDESISVYIRAVLQTRPSPDQILDASFSHRDKLFQTKSDHEPELVFDCVNDVLSEAYEQHFGCSPWTSYLKPSTSEFLREDRLVSEVVKDVKCLLLPKMLQPTLDQLVGHDIATSRTWLDTRIDTEELVYQIAEDVIEESIVQTILVLQN